MEKETKSIYEELGVDPHKSTVREIFDKVTDNDVPGAFCKLVRDPSDPKYLVAKHSDGSGSITITRYLYYLETGDESVLQDDPFSALSMNTGDIASVGAILEPYFLTDTIGINSANVDKTVFLRNMAIGFARVFKLYREYGFNIKFCGGETADLPDQIQSCVLDMDILSRVHERSLISGNVQPNDSIFGVSSAGKAFWEKEANSGHGCNGSTMTRIVMLHKDYAEKYPYLCREKKPFRGRFRVTDYVEDLGMTVGKAILSPTRQWAIIIKGIILGLSARKALHLLHAISVNTGGGATKIMNVGKGITYVKKMPEPSPLFQLIQSESNETWKNMYTTYNMTVGLDVIGSSERGVLEDVLKQVTQSMKIEYFKLGHCENSGLPGNKMVLETKYGTFTY